MKFVIIFLTITISGLTLATSPPHPCQCWPDWDPIKDGGDWHCKDPKSEKTSQCNIDIPPICSCKEKGEVVALPFGQINCVGGGNNKYDNINCESTPEWEAWFGKYPQFRLYH